MSTPEQTPTPSDEAARAAAAAANRGASREEVREEIATALAGHRAGAQNLSDEDKDAIADRMIAKLDERGAFDPAPAPQGADPSTPPGDTGGTPQTVDGAVKQPDPQPRKQTLAERFVGRKPS